MAEYLWVVLPLLSHFVAILGYPKTAVKLEELLEMPLSAGFSGTFALDSKGVVWGTGFTNFIGKNFAGQYLYTGALKPVAIVNNISDLTVGYDMNFITNKSGGLMLWGNNRGKSGTGSALPAEHHTITSTGSPTTVANYSVIANDAPVVPTTPVNVNPVVVTPGTTVIPIPDTSVVTPVTTVPSGTVIPVTVVTTAAKPNLPVPVTSVPVGTVVTPVVTVVPPVVNHNDDNVLTTECKNGYGYGDTNHCHIKEDTINKEKGHN